MPQIQGSTHVNPIDTENFQQKVDTNSDGIASFDEIAHAATINSENPTNNIADVTLEQRKQFIADANNALKNSSSTTSIESTEFTVQAISSMTALMNASHGL